MTGTAPGAKPPSEDDTKATQKSRINKKSGRDGKPAGEWAAENNIGNGPNRFLPAGAPALAAAKGKIRARPAPVSPRGPLFGKKGIEFFEFFRRRPLIRDSLAPRQPRGLSRCAALYQQSQATLGGAGRSGAAVSASFFPLSNKETSTIEVIPMGQCAGPRRANRRRRQKRGKASPPRKMKNPKTSRKTRRRIAARSFGLSRKNRKKAKEAKEKTPGRAKRATRWRSRAAPSIIRGIFLIRIPVGPGQTLFAQGRLLRILGVLERFHGRQAHVQPRGCERLGFELGLGQPL